MDLRKLLVFLTLFLVLAGFYNFVFAQGTATSSDDFLGIEDFTVQKIADILTGFACWLISVILVIMVIFLAWSGIRFFLARGNEVEVANARKNLTWTLVGILVIMATNVIIATVANALGGDYSYLPLDCANVTTRFKLKDCLGPEDCPAGYVCEIKPGEEVGGCYGQ